MRQKCFPRGGSETALRRPSPPRRRNKCTPSSILPPSRGVESARRDSGGPAQPAWPAKILRASRHSPEFPLWLTQSSLAHPETSRGAPVHPTCSLPCPCAEVWGMSAGTYPGPRRPPSPSSCCKPSEGCRRRKRALHATPPPLRPAPKTAGPLLIPATRDFSPRRPRGFPRAKSFSVGPALGLLHPYGCRPRRKKWESQQLFFANWHFRPMLTTENLESFQTGVRSFVQPQFLVS